jgi:hypothetical protein
MAKVISITLVMISLELFQHVNVCCHAKDFREREIYYFIGKLRIESTTTSSISLQKEVPFDLKLTGNSLYIIDY